MSKPEWGAKRACGNCGTRFYDLMRSPIICPKCGATVEPEVQVKSRRSAPVEKVAPVVPVAVDEDVLDTEVADDDLEAVDDDDGDEAEAAEEDEALIEDASDLGEDDDDMAEVIDHIDEDEDEA